MAARLFEKVLIANRGEIALRILRACHALGIKTVAVYSTADMDANYVKLADESVCIGPPASAQSYLHIPALISAAEVTGADAIHPGYGFLSENPGFAERVESSGFTFIGPSPAVIRAMGDKIQAKATVKSVGMPCVPGYDECLPIDLGQCFECIAHIGYPIMLKASGGGGGRGLRVVHNECDFEMSLLTIREEAQLAFGNSDVYAERYLQKPRHIEVQVLADAYGHVLILGDRDCSMQRRHQKIIEEAPAPAIPASVREKMHRSCVDVCRQIAYCGAGTFEFLYENGEFFFLEMNTRVQVEHTVTEMVTGIDIVRAQILIASGFPLPYQQSDVTISGHAIQCRINAEDPFRWIPSPGVVTAYHTPGGPGIRVDSHVYQGYRISPYYDSMVAKLIAHGEDRSLAIQRMRVALSELVIEGIQTNVLLHQALLHQEAFLSTSIDIHYLEAEVVRLMERARS